MFDNRPLRRAVLLNVLLLALYAWTASESTEIVVNVQGNHLSAIANGYRADVDEPFAPGDRVGLYLGAPGERWTYDDAGPKADSPLAFLGKAAAWLREEPLGTTWRRLAVDPPDPTQPARDLAFGKIASGQIKLLDRVAQPAFTLRATLDRGIVPAGIMLQARDEQNGVLLLVRPEHRDLLWMRIEDGNWQGPIAAGFWSKTWVGMLQDVLRVLLVAQLMGLALIVGLLAAVRAVAGAGAMGRRMLLVHRATPTGNVADLRVGPYDGGQDEVPFDSRRSHAGSGADASSAAGPNSVGADRSVRPRSRSGSHDAVFSELLDRPHRANEDTGRSFRYGSNAATAAPAGRLGNRRLAALGTPLAVAILALGLAGAAAWVAYFLLEAMPHVQDSVTYLFQARVFALGRLWVPASAIPAAFEQEFIVNYAGRAFGKYPPGHSLALLAGVLAQVPWLVNPIQAGLSVVVTYFVGREAWGRGAGLIAALLLATSPFVIFMSGSFMAHPTGLLFTLLFALFFLRQCRRPRLRWALLAGATLGFVLLTRPYTAVGIAVPFAAYAGYRVLRSRAAGLRAFGPILLAFIPFALALVAYNYALTGIFLKTPMELWWPFDKVGFGPGIGIAGVHTPVGGLWNTYRNLTELAKDLFGWPANVTLALAFVPFLCWRARRTECLLLASAFALMIAHIAWWADGVMYGPRYYYEIGGFLILLTARGTIVLAELCQTTMRRSSSPHAAHHKRAVLAALPVALLVVILVGYNVAYYLPEQWPLHSGYNFINAGKLRAVAAQQIHNAVVFVDLGDWYEWWNYGAVFTANTPTLDGDVVYARNLGQAENRRVMDLYPGRGYYRLSGMALQELKRDEISGRP